MRFFRISFRNSNFFGISSFFFFENTFTDCFYHQVILISNVFCITSGIAPRISQTMLTSISPTISPVIYSGLSPRISSGAPPDVTPEIPLFYHQEIFSPRVHISMNFFRNTSRGNPQRISIQNFNPKNQFFTGFPPFLEILL